MTTKKVRYSKSEIPKVPIDKPVVYTIQTEGGRPNYVGIAERGRAQERLNEHLTAGVVPGATVQVEQVDSIAEARKKEADKIARSKPKYNKQGK